MVTLLRKIQEAGFFTGLVGGFIGVTVATFFVADPIMIFLAGAVLGGVAGTVANLIILR